MWFLASEYQSKKMGILGGVKRSVRRIPLHMDPDSSSDPVPASDHDRDPDPGPTMLWIQIQSEREKNPSINLF